MTCICTHIINPMKKFLSFKYKKECTSVPFPLSFEESSIRHFIHLLCLLTCSYPNKIASQNFIDICFAFKMTLVANSLFSKINASSYYYPMRVPIATSIHCQFEFKHVFFSSSLIRIVYIRLICTVF